MYKQKVRGLALPSPAIVVAILALALGLGGSAIAGGGASKSFVKKQIKKNAPVAKGATEDNLGENVDTVDVSIKANQRGKLHIVGSVWALYGAGEGQVDCRLKVDGKDVDFSFRRSYVPDDISANAVCATNGTVPVKKGKHTVTLAVNDSGQTLIDNASVDAIFVP